MQLRKVEHKLVELKASVDDLQPFRRKLINLKAQHIGTFRQTDTYFKVPQGRLKLREVKDDERAELVYYEREDIARPKESDIFILEIQKPEFIKILLGKVLKTKTTVEKIRDIYRYKGIQIHLDIVKKLGTFIEFERDTSANPEAIRRNQQVLERLMKKLGIKTENIERLSYCDLIQK